MATAHSLSAPANEQPPSSGEAKAVEIVTEEALEPSSQDAENDELISFNAVVARLPVELDVAVPVRDFRVRNLLALEGGQVIETTWGHGEDMPLSAGDVQLAWSEFELVDTELAVRLTRLA